MDKNNLMKLLSNSYKKLLWFKMADRKSKKINYMFKLPSTFMTDDVKKTQSEAIHAFVQMRYSAVSKCNKDTLENDIKTFQTKLKEYGDAIVEAMKSGSEKSCSEK